MQELRQEDFGITDDELKELEQNYQYSEDEEKKAVLRELIELQRKKKELSFMEMKLKIQLSDPEETKKMLEIVAKKHESILENFVDNDNFSEVHKINTTPEEESLYDRKKNFPLQALPSVLDKFKEHPIQKQMQKKKVIDLRKQRHKKKPSDYLSNLAIAKLALDHGERIARLEEQILLSNERFHSLGLAVVDLQIKQELQEGTIIDVDEKIDFLRNLGVHIDKLVVFKASMLNPSLTQEELGNLVGKSRNTVGTWLKNLDALLEGYQKG